MRKVPGGHFSINGANRMNQIIAVRAQRMGTDVLVTGYSARPKNRKQEFQFTCRRHDKEALAAEFEKVGLIRKPAKAS